MSLNVQLIMAKMGNFILKCITTIKTTLKFCKHLYLQNPLKININLKVHTLKHIK